MNGSTISAVISVNNRFPTDLQGIPQQTVCSAFSFMHTDTGMNHKIIHRI